MPKTMLQDYLDRAPADIKEKAVLAADTTKLMRLLLANALGCDVADVSIDASVNLAISVLNSIPKNAG